MSMTALMSIPPTMNMSGATELYKTLAEIQTVSSAEFRPERHEDNVSSISVVLSQRSHSTLSRYTTRQQILIVSKRPEEENTHIEKHVGEQGIDLHALPPEPSVQSSDDTIRAIFSAYIPNLRQSRTAVLREEGDGTNSSRKRRSVELWHREERLGVVDVTDVHSTFIVDETFGSFSICPATGQKVLYSAEANKPEKQWKGAREDQSYEIGKGTSGSTRESGSYFDAFQAYEYRPGLGEKMAGRSRPTVWMAVFDDLSKKAEVDKRGQSDCRQAARVSRLRLQVSDIKAMGQDIREPLLGQASFDSDARTIIATAYSMLGDGRRLGIVYCTNRRAAILRAYLSDVPQNDNTRPSASGDRIVSVLRWARLSNAGVSARSPRVLANSQGTSPSFVWLQNEEAGAHNDCTALVSYDDDIENEANETSYGDESRNAKLRVQLPFQRCPSHDGLGWPGLYLDQLPHNCQVEGGVVTSTIWGCRKTIILQRLYSASSSFASGNPAFPVINLTPSSDDGAQLWSYSLLCTDGKRLVVAVRSSPFRPQQLLIGRLLFCDARSEHTTVKIQWFIARDLGSSTQEKKRGFLDLLVGLEAGVVEQNQSGTNTSVKGKDLLPRVQSIILRPSSPSNGVAARCGILFPHGGPHGATTIDWNPALAALTACGFSIILPNYRGSLGRGQDFAHALLGKCGDFDAQDCLDAIMQHLVEPGLVDRNKLIVMGGSHGGFLAAHLIGQHPDVFKAAVMRNPVISIGTMESSTDIPDWCYSELGLNFRFDFPPGFPQSGGALPKHLFDLLQSKSPIIHVDRVNAAVLLLVGLDDQRVPPTQSRLYYHALAGRRQKAQGQELNGNSVKMLCFEGADHALDTVEAELVGWEASFRWIVHHVL